MYDIHTIHALRRWEKEMEISPSFPFLEQFCSEYLLPFAFLTPYPAMVGSITVGRMTCSLAVCHGGDMGYPHICLQKRRGQSWTPSSSPASFLSIILVPAAGGILARRDPSIPSQTEWKRQQKVRSGGEGRNERQFQIRRQSNPLLTSCPPNHPQPTNQPRVLS